MRHSYVLVGSDHDAKSAVFETVHGTVQTPVFMNVATAGAIKGAVTSQDLMGIGTQIVLSNTYHLHVRPGDGVVRQFGGLRAFMDWTGPVFTDSGGFQVFSLSGMRKIKEEGVTFHSHVDGRLIFMGPEESINIQSNLGSTVAMAFDECPSSLSDRRYIQDSVDRTTRWLSRCVAQMQLLSGNESTLNRDQLLFGINQGGVFPDIRIEHAKRIADMDLPGYAIGGLAVGEPAETMYDIIEHVRPYLPKNKPLYLMGVGTPENILQAVARGIDFFDCVYPTRNGRHGHAYTRRGKINLLNARYETDHEPIDPGCGCPYCKVYSAGYVRHLLKAKELLGLRIMVTHNLYFYNDLMARIREAIRAGVYESFMEHELDRYRE